MKPGRPDASPLELDPEGTIAILCEFLKRELERTGLRNYVIGLSGGIDSAVSAALAVRAIGPKRVFPIFMPYRTSDPRSRQDAQRLADQLETPLDSVEISGMVDGFQAVSGDANRLRLGNVMSRCRMILLYDRSVVHQALVLGTSNKTELLLGYGTLFGDMASALNPIGDLYKTQVYDLARALNVPDSLIDKAPSADLWPDQTDEKELGFDYPTVDRLLHLMVDARLSNARLAELGFDEVWIERIQTRVRRNQFKRVQPVIAKLSIRTFGWDFRYPRDWGT